MKTLLTITLFFLTFSLQAQNISAAENELNLYIDSIYNINGVNSNDAQLEFFSNYKKVKSFNDFFIYVSKKMKKKKTFKTSTLKHKELLAPFSQTSHIVYQNIENKVFNLINKYDIWADANIITYLNSISHEFNYWGMNIYKPALLGTKLNKFYSYSKNTELINKVVLIFLCEKMFQYDELIEQSIICEQRYRSPTFPGIKTEEGTIIIDSLFENTIEPIFPGGYLFMAQYISNNFKYP